MAPGLTDLIRARLPQPIKNALRPGVVRSVRAGRALRARIRREFANRLARIHEKPVFVLGNQRSGTSAIAALLGEISGLSVTIDLPLANREAVYGQIRNGDLPFGKFIRANKLEFSRAIIKEPHLTVFYRELAETFPEARFVFIVRDPRDNIRSILNRLRIPGSLPSLRSEDRQWIVDSWPLVLDGRWLGLEGKNYIELLAARWNFLVDLFLESKKDMVLIRYEDFLADKAGQIKLLARKLGLAATCDISGRVDVQYQVPGDRNAVRLAFFGQDNLRQIERICGSRMGRLSYPLEAASNEAPRRS